MAGRFAASKFKNTHAKPAKREDCVTELPIGGVSSTNNGIAAGRDFLAFHLDGDGGKLGILRNDAKGRKSREELTILCAHADGAADFGFLPFQRDVLATVGGSEGLSLWALGGEDENGNPALSTASAGIYLGEEGGECLAFHPAAADILGVGSAEGAFLLDLEAEKLVSELRSGWAEKAVSGSWDGEGQRLLIQDKSSRIAIFDPRSGLEPVEKIVNVHTGKGREARALFLGTEGKILTSGFSKMRQREIFLYDVRKPETQLHCQPFESSTGVIVPLYDPDTKLIFLAGKGSNKIHLCELLSKVPYLGEVGSISPNEQTLGACLLPKWSLDVMQGEVARLIQLNRNSLYPVSCSVPRKTYRDFIPELFPPTKASTPGTKAADWFAGTNTPAPKYSLDPIHAEKVDKEPATEATIKPAPPTVSAPPVTPAPPPANQTITHTNGHNGTHHNGVSNGTNGVNGKASPPEKTMSGGGDGSVAFRKPDSDAAKPAKIDLTASYAERPKSEFQPLAAPKVALRSTTDGAPRPSPAAANRQTIAVAGPTASLFGARRTKFKHVSVKMETAKDKIFYNLRKVNTQLPLECGGFAVSDLWAAVPMAGSSGLVAIFDLSSPSKVPDGIIPGLENGGLVGDLRWDPFNPSRLAVGLDTGLLNIWTIPAGGLSEIVAEPAKTWSAHGSKLINLEWNPVAADVLATSGLDGELRLWDVGEATPQAKVSIPHPKALLAMAWSAHGQRIATAAKDGRIRVFDARHPASPVAEAAVLSSVKAARLIWVLNDEFLLLSAFGRSSTREVSLFRADTLELVASKSFDQASVLLIPHYDFDANLVYLSGKGDVTLHQFEVIAEAPWFLDIPAWKDKEPHQGFSFQHKRLCDVRKVEVAKAWRLKLAEIQPLSFTVPRRHLDKFQNDLYPPAIARWQPALTAQKWFAGDPAGAVFQDLNPGMELLYPENAAAATKQTSPPTKPPPSTIVPPAIGAKPSALPPLKETPLPPAKPVEKEDLMSSMAEKMDALGAGKGLEQDHFDGVAEEEWNEQ